MKKRNIKGLKYVVDHYPVRPQVQIYYIDDEDSEMIYKEAKVSWEVSTKPNLKKNKVRLESEIIPHIIHRGKEEVFKLREADNLEETIIEQAKENYIHLIKIDNPTKMELAIRTHGKKFTNQSLFRTYVRNKNERCNLSVIMENPSLNPYLDTIGQDQEDPEGYLDCLEKFYIKKHGRR